MPEEISLNVNGKTHLINVDGDTPLLYVLRNDLGLKSAKFGCGLEQCGACKVMIDSEALPTCKCTVESVQNYEITTLEGFETVDGLHPIQEAFLYEQAAQCGYCTAGMIIATKALLDLNPNPTDQEIKSALHIHICRCGTHSRILKAVKRAAKALSK